MSNSYPTLREVRERDNGVCFLCLLPVRPGDGDMGHLVAASRGGQKKLSNLRFTHKRCNAGWGSKTMIRGALAPSRGENP